MASTSDGRTDGVVRLEELFKREYESLHRQCLRLLGNSHDAEEAVQEAFARLAPKLESLEGEPGAYVNVVARRVCWEMLRRSSRTAPITPSERVDDDPAAATVARSGIRRAWSRLSPVERRLILGSYIGYTYEEMAVQTGLTAKAVSVGLHRARKRVRSLLDGSTGILAPLGAFRHRVRSWRDRLELWWQRIGQQLVGAGLIETIAPVAAAALALGAASTPGQVGTGSPGSGPAMLTQAPIVAAGLGSSRRQDPPAGAGAASRRVIGNGSTPSLINLVALPGQVNQNLPGHRPPVGSRPDQCGANGGLNTVCVPLGAVSPPGPVQPQSLSFKVPLVPGQAPLPPGFLTPLPTLPRA